MPRETKSDQQQLPNAGHEFIRMIANAIVKQLKAKQCTSK
tara:strand:- start:592 stop:711 length:120 start_codon:yes stop_codon:yes gene_type:complete